MYSEERVTRRFYAVSYTDEEPTVSIGAFIPPQKRRSQTKVSYAPKTVTPQGRVHSPYVASVRVVTVFLSLFLLLCVTAFSVPLFSQSGVSRLPAQLAAVFSKESPVVVENPYTAAQTPLTYGVQMSFTEPSFFTETRDSFIRDEKTFLEADLTTMQLRYFVEGVLAKQVAILAKGEKGSWWQTPAGLYEVKSKTKNYFSDFGQVYMPWNLSFQGNFSIHGVPYTTKDADTNTGYLGGCIRLRDTDAEEIFALVETGTPLLVHEVTDQTDSFVYEPKIPELKTPHYLIADIESSTVLASSDLDTAAPIASLTKLMTAVVAAEYINLDSKVSVTQPTFVQSLIPRLQGIQEVSMYSLLQLLLVESSNEAAEVIAAQIGRETFIAHMNDKAASLGLTNTHFADPSGISSDNTASVRDLLGLVQYIYNNRRFIVEITANQDLSTAYVGDEFGKLSNFNKVADLENFIGGKVGETTAAGQTSVSLHKIKVKGTERVVAIVILGSEGRNEDVIKLLNYAQERFGY